MRLVLIPGMDGTGLLFEPLINLLSSDIKTFVVSLNSLTSQQPEQMIAQVSAILINKYGNKDIVILAESYAGFMAYGLSLNHHLNIKHIIYAASFLASPNKLSFLHHFLPIKLITSKAIPAWLISRVLFGCKANPKLVKLLLESCLSVEHVILKKRLKHIHQMHTLIKQSTTASSYVLASNDYLVSRKSVNSFKIRCTNLRVLQAHGGHFIVQSNPHFFVNLINEINTCRNFHCPKV